MTTTAEEIKMNFDEVMCELKCVDVVAYDVLVVRKGLHERFKTKHNKVEIYNASKPILIMIKAFK